MRSFLVSERLVGASGLLLHLFSVQTVDRHKTNGGRTVFVRRPAASVRPRPPVAPSATRLGDVLIVTALYSKTLSFFFLVQNWIDGGTASERGRSRLNVSSSASKVCFFFLSLLIFQPRFSHKPSVSLRINNLLRLDEGVIGDQIYSVVGKKISLSRAKI